MQFYPTGTRIAGRYEVAGQPLIGGMGIVYLCDDRQEDRPVALKTFRPEYLPNRAARDRLLQEGDTWVRLARHPHIVRCYRVFPDIPRPEVYLVLDVVAKEEGRQDASLRSWLIPGRPLPVEQALLFGLQIARGMRHATELIPGFVHRDLKPENVLVGADLLSNAPINRVRITDFGLARGLQDPAPSQTEGMPVEGGFVTKPGRLTQMGALLGTAEYMAPEQWEGPDVATQADIYAFGCILGEMVTGRMLVCGEPRRELGRAHRAGAARTAVREVPAPLRELLDRCLALNPTDRYAGWVTLEAALAAAYRMATGQPPPGPEEAAGLSRAERVAAGLTYSEMGCYHILSGGIQAALGYFERAHQIGRTEAEPRLTLVALDYLGITYYLLGQYGPSIDFFERTLAIRREIGDRGGESTDLAHLGLAWLHLRDAQRAINCIEQALMIARETGDCRKEGGALNALGDAHLQLRDFQRAVGCYEQALEILREIGDRNAEREALDNLADAYCQLADGGRAINCLEQVLAICRETGNRNGEGDGLRGLGDAYLQLGDTRRAIDHYERALSIHRKIGSHANEGADLTALGSAYIHLKDFVRAIGYYEKALAIHREIGFRLGEAESLGNLGNACFQSGNVRRAADCWERVLAIHRELDDRLAEGNALTSLGVIHAILGDIRQAMEWDEQALTVHREINNRVGVATTCYAMALLYDRQGNPAQALPLAREAAYLLNEIGEIAGAREVEQFVAQLEECGR